MFNTLPKFVIVMVVIQVGGESLLLDSSSESRENNSTSESHEDLLGAILEANDSGGPKCGPTSNCPTHNCRLDPAVIHGYCCGCADESDSIKVSCPGNLQCPLFSEPLCSDYQYMIKCCC